MDRMIVQFVNYSICVTTVPLALSSRLYHVALIIILIRL